MLGWWHHRGDKNVLFLKYEDMKKYLLGSVSEIASFLKANTSHDTMEKIAEQTVFSNMKENSFCNSPWDQFIHDRSKTDFMRKGIVGDWKSFLTPEQSSELYSLCK